jgi:hypothetical protein
MAGFARLHDAGGADGMSQGQKIGEILVRRICRSSPPMV